MIILGNRYRFTKLEKERLRRQFDTINHVNYKDMSPSNTIKRLEKILKYTKKRVIVLNTQAVLPPPLLTYLTKLELRGIECIALDEFLGKYLNKCLISETSDSSSPLEKINSYTTWQYIQKRFVDYISVLVLSIPAILAIVYSKYRIAKESPGPLFFRQRRVGKDGKEFCCIKLRSMCVDAEKNGAQFACKNDPRAFPWGKTIRDKKIDELIQIWNVLKGEMHFVGPRPERKIWTKEFEKSIPFYNQRHVVAPGITGWAQIKYQYGSGKLDAQQKLSYDLYYIKHWSLKFELEIIWKTALFILTKRRENLSNF